LGDGGEQADEGSGSMELTFSHKALGLQVLQPPSTNTLFRVGSEVPRKEQSA